MLSIIGGHESVADAAARLGVSRQTVYNWRTAFEAGGRARLAGDTDAAVTAAAAAACPPDVGAAVAAIVSRLREVRGAEDLDIDTLEAIRTGAALPLGRFCELIGVPRRTYHTRRAARRAPPAPSRLAVAIEQVRAAHPEWGARRIWRQLAATGGPAVSLATVKRALARGS